MKKLFALFLVSLLVFSFNVDARPVVGDMAPDFNATDIEGKAVKLSELKDKIVVLE